MYHQPPYNSRRRKFMTVKYHQISLKDTFSDCRDMFMDDTPPSSGSLKNILISLILSLLPSMTPFISASAAKGIILLPASFPLSYFRRFSPSLRTHFLFFCSTSVRNCGISAASRKFLTLRFFPVSNPVLRTTLNSCSSVWWTSPNPSADKLILH